MRFRLLCFLFIALVSAATWAAVEGRVTAADGRPVRHARISVVGSDQVVFSAANGGFVLPESDPPRVAPLELKVSHPRFASRTITIDDTSTSVEIALLVKQEIYEAIAVTASPGEEDFAPVSVAISTLDPEQSAAPPSTLTEFVAEVPSVAENGQGGIFQTYSVRGVSRLRVMTLLSGMRIVSERRAGVSASFVDPGLMGGADVLRGPSSTYYGSGALGGVVQFFPAAYDGWTVKTGFDTRGDETHQMVGWGQNGWSLGVARRDAGNSETPAGAELNTGFTQTSATLRKTWTSGKLEFDLLAVGSQGDDIQKSNTDFPNRTTTYPDETHALVRFGLKSSNGWNLTAYVHPNDLETEVSRTSGQLDTVLNDAIDMGASWQKRVQPNPKTVVRFGVDYFGRRSVDARETNQALNDGGALVETGQQKTLDGGEEDESGLFGAVEWNLGSATILAGGRYAYQEQSNGNAPGTDDGALTGFAGVVAPLGSGFEAVANVGSGLRFPSLGERFFAGTTGRGFVRGNPDLNPERSLNSDVGLRWYGGKLFMSGYLFRNDIDDYIERIEIGAGELTFVNLTAGTIEGVELEGFYQLAPDWGISFGGHSIDGRDDENVPLADIPSDSLFVGGRGSQGKWSWASRLELRASKTDPGSGEKNIPSVNLLSSSVSYEVQPGLRLALSGRNLLDEEYFNSADSDVSFSAERSFSASLIWAP